jgi:hypothetical protein
VPAESSTPVSGVGENPACAEALAKPLGIIPFISRYDLEPLTRSAPFARTDEDGIQQGEDDLGPLVAISRRCTRRQGHAGAVRETMDQDTLAFPTMGNPLTASLPGGIGTVDGAILSPNHPTFLGQSEQASLHRGSRPIALPAL